MRVSVSSSLALAFVLAMTMSAAAQTTKPARFAEDIIQTAVSAREARQSQSEPLSLDLPHIRKLRIRRISIEPPTLEHFKSSLPRSKEAIEFIVETDGPVPIRAYGPALFVGDIEVNQSERVDKTTWRLLAFEPERLEAGAPISWGWMRDPQTARQATKFRYSVKGRTAKSR